MASGCYVNQSGLMLREEWECFVKSNDEFIKGLQVIYKKWDIGYLRDILTLCYVEPEVAGERGNGEMCFGGMDNGDDIVQYGKQEKEVEGQKGQINDDMYVTHDAHMAQYQQVGAVEDQEGQVVEAFVVHNAAHYAIWGDVFEMGRVEDLIGLGEEIGLYPKLNNQIRDYLEVIFYNRHVLEPIEEEVIGMYMGNLVQMNESKLDSGSTGGQGGQIVVDTYVTYDDHMAQQGVKLVKCLEIFSNKDMVDQLEDKEYGFQGWYERSVIKGWSGVPGLGQGRQRPPPEPPPIMDIVLEEFWLITDGKFWNWCGFCWDMLQYTLI